MPLCEFWVGKLRKKDSESQAQTKMKLKSYRLEFSKNTT
jgi:hypothetical protein